MKLTLEPTDKIVQIASVDGLVTARIWQGEDDQGVPVFCVITRVVVSESQPLAVHARFAADLLETVPMRSDVATFPLRLII